MGLGAWRWGGFGGRSLGLADIDIAYLVVQQSWTGTAEGCWVGRWLGLMSIDIPVGATMYGCELQRGLLLVGLDEDIIGAIWYR